MKSLYTIIILSSLFSFVEAATSAKIIGESVTITVTSDGTQPFTYQWYKNGEVIIGATAKTLVLNNLVGTDSASYTVKVSNQWGYVYSDKATLTVTGVKPKTATTSFIESSLPASP